ncbi:MAG: hypothetical protein FWF08_08020 [Oscillospiraceae bacterium]|nr:hypothetical protein [Oscillospiraceae bacterium]
MNTRTIPITLTDGREPLIVDFAGYTGEHRASLLEIKIPDGLKDAGAKYYIEYSRLSGEAQRSDYLELSPDGGKILYYIPSAITNQLVSECFVNAVLTENGEVARKIKSKKVILNFYPSPNPDELIDERCGDKLYELLEAVKSGSVEGLLSGDFKLEELIKRLSAAGYGPVNEYLQEIKDCILPLYLKGYEYGKAIEVGDASEANLMSLAVIGETKTAGEPSPLSPVAITGAGPGLTVNIYGKKTVFDGSDDEIWMERFPVSDNNVHVYYISLDDSVTGVRTSDAEGFTSVNAIQTFAVPLFRYSDHPTEKYKYFSSAAETAEAWKNWLKLNPVTVTYTSSISQTLISPLYSAGGDADNFDFASGKLSKKICRCALTGDDEEMWVEETAGENAGSKLYHMQNILAKDGQAVICTHFPSGDITSPQSGDNGICCKDGGLYVRMRADTGVNGLAAFKNWLSEQYENGLQVDILYKLDAVSCVIYGELEEMMQAFLNAPLQARPVSGCLPVMRLSSPDECSHLISLTYAKDANENYTPIISWKQAVEGLGKGLYAAQLSGDNALNGLKDGRYRYSIEPGSADANIVGWAGDTVVNSFYQAENRFRWQFFFDTSGRAGFRAKYGQFTDGDKATEITGLFLSFTLTNGTVSDCCDLSLRSGVHYAHNGAGQTGAANRPTGDAGFMIRLGRGFMPNISSAFNLFLCQASNEIYIKSYNTQTGWGEWKKMLSPSDFQYEFDTAAKSGYQKLQGGIILQWGKSVPSGGFVSAVFPEPFPSGCQSVTVTGRADGTAAVPASCGNVTNTGFTIASAASEVFWQAIGM